MPEPLFTERDVLRLRGYAESANAGCLEDFNDGYAGHFFVSLADRLERYVATDQLRQIVDLSPMITAALDHGKSVEIGVQPNGVHRILRVIDETNLSEG